MTSMWTQVSISNRCFYILCSDLNNNLFNYPEHSNKPADIKCDYPDCEKMFTTRIYKARHIRSTHTHRQKTPTEAAFICHECGKAFVAFSRLREHLYIHMPNVEKPHKCGQCGKSFIKKHKLKNHTMRHEGIKNFVCPHCGMRKTTKEELRVHINCEFIN
jgi:DNA-directed RNA polymerase subunit RPC12/RpoP